MGGPINRMVAHDETLKDGDYADRVPFFRRRSRRTGVGAVPRVRSGLYWKEILIPTLKACSRRPAESEGV